MQEHTLDILDSQARLPIPGYEGRYEIDQLANVYALFPFRNEPAGRMMNCRPNKDGYKTIALTKDGRSKTFFLHRIMLLIWQPNENSYDLEVNHIDGIKANCRLDNLEWLTHHQNMLHARTIPGTWKTHRGESIGSAKVTDEEVREIRQIWDNRKMSQREIARRYGVTQVAVHHIVARKSWKHIE